MILALLMPLPKRRIQVGGSPEHFIEFGDKIFKTLKSLYKGGISGLSVEDDQIHIKIFPFLVS